MILVGVITCPIVLTKETILEKFKDVLSNHYHLCVCRDITLPIHEIFEVVFEKAEKAFEKAEKPL